MANRDDARRPSQRVADDLRAKISRGDPGYRPGEKLPTVRELRERYGVAANTAAAAVRMLAREGLVSIRPSSGTVVLPPGERPADVREKITAIHAHLRRSRSEIDKAETELQKLLDRLPASGKTI
ncbi:hypothetical protein Acsp04_58770 [Actinomadura sp. NBRC 104425]|uniref:GntR family transcriptional regulator n=1 Tax=Actinomadura sp. NBRC 104425 TaxID=3032204 RepID=UPI0024A37357|nr:GntR family transcriptional regulator [Actinomadura sp. NBRC 104425]GLZ15642.1 hypothetical protein Acsp04_58770 [Actinomadura sp. NBRC 104425]